MYFCFSKVILSTTLSLLVLSSSAIAGEEDGTEKKNKTNRQLRGKNVVEEDVMPNLNEIGGIIGKQEDSLHHKDGLMVDALEPLVLDQNETSSRLLSSSYDNTDITIYGGVWGEWKTQMKTQQNGLYACGAELRFESRQGGGDDTAANGLRLKYCGLSDWHNQDQQTIWNGNWGDWRGMVMCPYGKYIGAGNVRFEDAIGRGGDDTALNGLAIWCVDKNWNYGEMEVVYYGEWGGWKGWNYEVGKLVKGARVRYEDPIGNGDDTAMNGIQFNIEKPNYGVSRSEITGTWASVTSGPQGQFSHTIIESTETSQSKELTKEETYGFTQSIETGFKIKVIDFSVTVSASQSFRTAQTMKHSLRVYRGTETTLACPNSGSSTGYYYMWQFVMSQPSDASGIGFNSKTKHIRCTTSYYEVPRCALGSCEDAFCQRCIA